MRILLVLLLLSNLTLAQTVIGKWKTIDDNSGKEKSIIEITERGGKLYGKILKIFPDAGKDTDPICDKCPTDDPRYKKKIIGMEIIKDLIKDDDEYGDGTILDPEPGEIYRCKIWLEGKDLKVRGYLGPFYRTQTWKKVQ
jgi:uncharacterized protein (DUF2147 family)